MVDEEKYTLLIGNCLDTLKELNNGHAYTCVTSPPYFGLRDYGLPETSWPGMEYSPMPGMPSVQVPAMSCCLGLESDPTAYVGHLVLVFREVWRVLKDEGTMWLNLGDSYARTGGTDRKVSSTAKVGSTRNTLEQMSDRTSRAESAGLKEKDLIGIPWRAALALQADGWYLRQDIIWHKPNPMPESVKDRCTKAHEYIFLLSKNKKYYYDSDAIKEPAICGAKGSEFHTGKTGAHQLGRAQKVRPSKPKGYFSGKTEAMSKTGQNAFRSVTDYRNRRTVWTVSTTPYKGHHFATFPPALIEPCILAGCPRGGVVVDPFGGSGTTAGVALKNGRNATICELSPEYATLIPDRVDTIKSSSVKTTRSTKSKRCLSPLQEDIFRIGDESL